MVKDHYRNSKTFESICRRIANSIFRLARLLACRSISTFIFFLVAFDFEYFAGFCLWATLSVFGKFRYPWIQIIDRVIMHSVGFQCLPIQKSIAKTVILLCHCITSTHTVVSRAIWDADLRCHACSGPRVEILQSIMFYTILKSLFLWSFGLLVFYVCLSLYLLLSWDLIYRYHFTYFMLPLGVQQNWYMNGASSVFGHLLYLLAFFCSWTWGSDTGHRSAVWAE